MQKLSILEMEEVQGGWLGALACAVVGAGVGMVATPFVGVPVGFMCGALLNPTPAY
ncbi:MAG: hypothetical protein HC913_04785 [Microscillaceae bacterium]|nr:hypothetical protein [Microscillaceae bacterium]